MIKTCTRCGRQFGTERKSNVCSDCQVIRQREYSLNYVNKNRDKLKEKRRIKKMFTDGVIYHKITDSELKIIEDNRKALAEGDDLRSVYGEEVLKCGQLKKEL